MIGCIYEMIVLEAVLAVHLIQAIHQRNRAHKVVQPGMHPRHHILAHHIQAVATQSVQHRVDDTASMLTWSSNKNIRVKSLAVAMMRARRDHRGGIALTVIQVLIPMKYNHMIQIHSVT